MASIVTIGEGTERERKKVVYDIVTNDGSRKRKSKTFPSKTPMAIIKKFKREVEEEKYEGIFVDSRKRTLDEFVEEYFEKFGKLISPTTVKGYKAIYNNPNCGIKKKFGNCQISKITTAVVQGYVSEMMDAGLSPKSIHNYTMFLHVLFQKAIKLNYIKKGCNPVEDVEKPKREPPKIEAYTADEARRLIQLAESYGSDNLRYIVYTFLGTGIRRGELAALRVESVNLEKKELYITHSVAYINKEVILKQPKTSSGIRTISLPESVVRVMREAVLRYKKKKMKFGAGFVDSGFLLCNENGKPYCLDYIYNIYNRFMKKVAVKHGLRYLYPHQLRHTFASLALENHSDIKAVQETLGHKDATVTLNVYAHAYKEAKDRQAATIDNVVFRICTNREKSDILES